MSESYFENDDECGILVYKIKYSNTISIYITKLDYETPSIIRYYLIAYNSKTKKVTKALPNINGKLDDKPEGIPYIDGNWMDNLETGFDPKYRFLERPFIYFISNDLFKNKLIVIKRRAHNGTAYNGETRCFYTINDEMELNQFLYLESKVIVWAWGEDECMITRKLENDNIINFIQCGSEESKYLGRVQIKYLNKKVSIVSSTVEIEGIDKSWLVTASGKPEEEFLNK